MKPRKVMATSVRTLWVCALLVGLAAPFQPVTAGAVAIRPAPDIDEGRLPSPPPPHVFASAPTAGPACSADTSAKGKILALLIGINDYRSSAIPDLKGSANDVGLLRQVLLARGAYSRDVAVLTDATATLENIFQHIDGLIAQASCGDSVFIHFSGQQTRQPHVSGGGMPDTSISTVLLAHDTPLGDPEVKSPVGLGGRDLAAALVHIRNKGANVFLSVDTCHTDGLNIRWYQHAADRSQLWRWTPKAEAPIEISSFPELEPGAGEYAGFYAAQTDELTSELTFEQQVFGVFSFSLAHAIEESDTVSLRELAEKVDLLQRTRVPLEPGRMYLASSVFEASDPDAEFLAIGQPRKPRGGITFESEALTRGTLRTGSASFQVTGKIENPADVLVVLVGPQEAKMMPDGGFAADVTLAPGENRLPVIAFYRDKTLARGIARVEYDSAGPLTPGPGRRFALLIGNQNYQDPAIEDLHTPIADTDALARVLTRLYGFTTAIDLPDGTRHSLVLKDATRAEILGTLSLLGKVLDENDELVLYYAGHGELVEQINEAYWLPADARASEHWSWISARDLTNQFVFMQARHILVISDSCYSGALTREITDADELRERSSQEKRRLRSRKLLSSGAEQPVWDGGGDQHSVFAKALLDGLEHIDRPYFTPGELFHDYVEQQVAGGSEQVPQYEGLQKSGHQGGELVLFRVASADHRETEAL